MRDLEKSCRRVRSIDWSAESFSYFILEKVEDGSGKRLRGTEKRRD
jgi:hypothetical protein